MINNTREGTTKYKMSQDMFAISIFVLPSYFIKKKTRKDVRGRDFNRAPPTGVFSDNFVTVAIINADIRILMKKYMKLFP
jgi:hypothetical protein